MHIIGAEMTLQMAMRDSRCRSLIRSHCKTCIASFSVHHVHDQIAVVSSLSIPMYGCCYVYDNMVDGDKITDSSGATMAVEDGLGIFTWPGGKRFMEDLVYSSDFVPALVLHISDLDLPGDMASDDLGPVMQRLVVVMTQ